MGKMALTPKRDGRAERSEQRGAEGQGLRPLKGPVVAEMRGDGERRRNLRSGEMSPPWPAASADQRLQWEQESRTRKYIPPAVPRTGALRGRPV